MPMNHQRIIIFSVKNGVSHQFHREESEQQLTGYSIYVVGPESFWPDIQKPRQMENAVRDT